MKLGNGLGILYNRTTILTPALPTNFTSSFTVDAISGSLSWIDNSGGAAQYEVYSSYNGNPYVFLGTTLAGATSYIDTTCKQNASVVYRIRAKKGGTYSEYATTSAINTPLCFKTDQSVLTTISAGSFVVTSGSITVNWGDGTSNIYSGSSVASKSYSVTGQYNISMTGDVNNLQYFLFYALPIYGDISNWIFPQSLVFLNIRSTNLSGDISNWVLPSTLTQFRIYETMLVGKLPSIISGAFNDLLYLAYGIGMYGTNMTQFRRAATIIDIKNQTVAFPTSEVDKFFKAAADWYQLNPPTANCTYNLSGANMGIPTGGASNVDIVRLSGYYTTAGFAATILVRTS